jgi:uncharacterized protein
MDKELKITVGIFLFLLGIATVLLEVLAHIHFWSPEFLRGFIPFVILLGPYILFSSQTFCDRSREVSRRSFLHKLIFPTLVLLAYLAGSLWTQTFRSDLMVRLILWLYVPVVLLSVRFLEGNRFYVKEIAAALILWLPIEFGALSGFDIIFTDGIQIPALALGAPVLGLYLFEILRNLPGIGYHFRWQASDFKPVAISLAILACLLIPFGVSSGFIHFSEFDTSFAEIIKLLFGIYFLNALPEELLFRGILQNLLTRMGNFWFGLIAASLIFGFSHYNNFSPPDMRYVWLASLAGAFYGWTYAKTGKTTISALVHTGVNVLWAIFFKGTGG